MTEGRRMDHSPLCRLLGQDEGNILLKNKKIIVTKVNDRSTQCVEHILKGKDSCLPLRSHCHKQKTNRSN